MLCVDLDITTATGDSPQLFMCTKPKIQIIKNKKTDTTSFIPGHKRQVKKLLSDSKALISKNMGHTHTHTHAHKVSTIKMNRDAYLQVCSWVVISRNVIRNIKPSVKKKGV